MIPVQKKTFSLAGMSPKSSNMTAKSDINTADTSTVYHLLVVGADALTMSEITDEGFCGVTTRAEKAIYDQKFSGIAADLLNANTIDRNF